MKVVLDTNILVSGTFWNGAPFEILKKINLKDVESITSKEIIDEYNMVINSEEIIEKSKDKGLTISEVAQRVIENSKIIEPKRKFDVVKEDPDDNKILECAKEGEVYFIISKDEHLLKLKEFEGIKIITPEEFLKTRKTETQ